MKNLKDKIHYNNFTHIDVKHSIGIKQVSRVKPPRLFFISYDIKNEHYWTYQK